MEDKKNTIIGIDLSAGKVQAAYFDNTCIEPIIVTNVAGYGGFSENSIEEVFLNLKEKIGNTEAAVAVPGYINYIQRQMIKNIAEKAGISIMRFINKTGAAAMAFEFDRTDKKEDKTIFVCTFDRGVFEIALAGAGDGITEINAIDWEKDFDEKNIDTARFNELCRRLIVEKERQLIEWAAARDNPVADIKFTSEQIDVIVLTCEPHHVPAILQMIADFFHKNHDAIIKTENAVAIGASINGAILSGNLRDVLLFDVISMSFGIETSGGVMTKMIRRNTVIPTRISKIFSSSFPGLAVISVFQGEDEIASKNCYLGTFSLQNINPLLQNVIKEIEVAIDIDANGIIHVSANDLASGGNKTGIKKEKNNKPFGMENIEKDVIEISSDQFSVFCGPWPFKWRL
jgi:molecular chaperone DnaK